MIFFDGKEWRDAEEMLESAARHSEEEYERVSAILEREGAI
jgi:hypothetical protein|tara:strand:+ start:438 stop:560 length:123 start_codon:yes stop_codon:yes gene_type:complete